MGFYLLDNPNPNGDHFYRTRRNEPRLLVVHVTAGLQDLDGVDDQSAQKTAQYAATTSRPVSWHVGADSDDFLYLLPWYYTAFHVQGYNSTGIGLEISKADTDWNKAPKAWVESTLRNAANAIRPAVIRYGIPCRLITRAQADAGEKGFIGHTSLDPSRRSDPGMVNRVETFPWSRFLAMVANAPAPPVLSEVDMAAVVQFKGIAPEGVPTQSQSALFALAGRVRSRITDEQEFWDLVAMGTIAPGTKTQVLDFDSPDPVIRSRAIRAAKMPVV